MIGVPKKCNSKNDYYYILTHFEPKVWRPFWELLRDGKMRWVLTGKLATEANGIIDETHRVEKIDTGTAENIKEEYYQYEYMLDPLSDFVRLGFTDEEIETVLGGK